MIKEIISVWEERKDVLRKELVHSPIFSYKKLVEKIVDIFLNHESQLYDLEKMRVIDDGDYQGTLIFIIPENTYQPNVNEYLYTYVYYGSCCGCDIMEDIQAQYDSSKSKETYDEVISDLMILSLHLIQRFKRMGDC